MHPYYLLWSIIWGQRNKIWITFLNWIVLSNECFCLFRSKCWFYHDIKKNSRGWHLDILCLWSYWAAMQPMAINSREMLQNYKNIYYKDNAKIHQNINLRFQVTTTECNTSRKIKRGKTYVYNLQIKNIFCTLTLQ